MKKKIRKILIQSLELVATAFTVVTILNVASYDALDNALVHYTTSIGSMICAFVIATTQGLMKRYMKSVFAAVAFLVIVTVIDFNKCQQSIVPILFIVSATVSLLTFYTIENDRKKQAALKQEVDDRPFIISKASDFDIKEEDFPEDNQNADQSSSEE
ncbi:MAG: hypothetical protein WC135_08400 [Bacteroidales bacterium]